MPCTHERSTTPGRAFASCVTRSGRTRPGGVGPRAGRSPQRRFDLLSRCRSCSEVSSSAHDDNQSRAHLLAGYVRFHAVWEEIGRISVPYSYARENASAELGWDISATTNLQALLRAAELGSHLPRGGKQRRGRAEAQLRHPGDLQPAVAQQLRVRGSQHRRLRHGGDGEQLHRARRAVQPSGHAEVPASGARATTSGT